MSANKILVANIGSTSFKFRLFEMPGERVLARGGVERIGAPQSQWKFAVGDKPEKSGMGAFADYDDAISMVESELTGKALENFTEIAAFGFKPVMAKGISGTQFMDESVLQAMEALSSVFPAHNPPYIKAVRAFRAKYPSIPCIGTFETAFFDDLPAHNRRMPVPLEWEEKFGIRRYGFHGASHRYVTDRVAQLRGSGDLRVISCHLGGSSSIACVKAGKAINSSWGMTPQSGLPQNNRVGDMDVFALFYAVKHCGIGLDRAEDILASEAGLKGMSGLASGDMRDLKAAAASGNARAREALDVYTACIRKFIGQFLVEMNGADVIAFAGGIGENNPDLREEVCRDMDFCGLALDKARNESAKGTEAVISVDGSKIEARAILTNEELIIARNAWVKCNEFG